MVKDQHKKVKDDAISDIAKAADIAIDKLADATEVATDKLANAADKASSAVASALLDANRLLASQASSAAKVVDSKQGNDHDLILEVKTIQTVMLGEIREIKTGTSQQIAELQEKKLDTKDSYPVVYRADVEKRLGGLETKVGNLENASIRITVMMGIASTIMMVLVGLLIKHMFI